MGAVVPWSRGMVEAENSRCILSLTTSARARLLCSIKRELAAGSERVRRLSHVRPSEPWARRRRPSGPTRRARQDHANRSHDYGSSLAPTYYARPWRAFVVRRGEVTWLCRAIAGVVS